MHIAFVDDTKQKSKRRGMTTLVALGAVIFPERQIKPFTDAFYATFDDLEIPHSVEMKWSPDKDNDWFRQNSKTSLLTPLRKRILTLAAEHDVTTVVAAWDIGAQRTLKGEPAEKWVIQFLFERISMFLENNNNLGLIVFDKPGGDHKADENWVQETKQLTKLGTEYVRPNAIVAPILTAHSHHHAQLQLADLVAGSTTAALAGTKYGQELIPLLKPLFNTNQFGLIGSTGLKIFPDRFNNLHHWVLGKSTSPEDVLPCRYPPKTSAGSSKTTG